MFIKTASASNYYYGYLIVHLQQHCYDATRRLFCNGIAREGTNFVDKKKNLLVLNTYNYNNKKDVMIIIIIVVVIVKL